MQPLANPGGSRQPRPRTRELSAMPYRNEKLERKDRLLAQLDPEHEVELEGTFINHLAAAIRASSTSECQIKRQRPMRTPSTMCSMRMGGSYSESRARRPKAAELLSRLGCRRHS